ncbi:MAG TPA: hypothetical protein VHG35_14760 [Gemmatimonadales bacterium]|nr:hypothetical protein [Gemmatimonadales bacterium]
MAASLLVPVHLDALRVAEPLAVVAPPVDFTRLPWTDGTRSVHPGTPYVGEAVVSPPFEKETLRLEPGIHLHWALPDALTRAVDGVFPPVPNRWLVARRGTDGVQAQWMVESDYLHPPGSPPPPGAIAYPVPPATDTDPPFRYCGRALPLAAWPARPGTGAGYLRELTAVGYGDPVFAAFYPSCRGVFGFHDPYTGPAVGVRYEVLGWYASAEADPLQRLRARHPAATAAVLLQALRDEHRWLLEGAEALPDGIVCYARLTLGPPETAPPDIQVGVGIGNTGLEALSAYLARALGAYYEVALERQIQAVGLGEQMGRRNATSLPEKFREARHEKGFAAVEAGTLWSVLSQVAAESPASDAPACSELTLPPALAHLLNTANVRQHEYDRACTTVQSLRRELFADWYRYLLCAHPPAGGREALPDPAEVRDFIERHALPNLEGAVAAAGTLTVHQDADGHVTGASADRTDTAAAELADAICELCGQTALLNGRSEAAATGRYRVIRRSSPRFWLASEPVVVLAGEPVRPSHRHGFDGRLHPDGLLRCHALSGLHPGDAVRAGLHALRARIDALAAQGGENPAFATGGGDPWNPLLLQWRATLAPPSPAGGTPPDRRDPSAGGYPHDYVTRDDTGFHDDPTQLSVGQVKSGAGYGTYEGTSILTPHAGLQMSRALGHELARLVKPRLLAGFYAGAGVADEGESGALARRDAFNAWLARQAPLLAPLPPDDGSRTATEQFDGWLRDNAEPASAWAQARNAVLASFYQQPWIQPGERNEAWLHANFRRFFDWYVFQIPTFLDREVAAARAGRPEAAAEQRAGLAAFKDDAQLVTLRAALLHLSRTPTLGQALSGFNEALVMRRQGFQLPVADPLAPAHIRSFVARVREAVAGEGQSAPRPLDGFIPIRTGDFQLEWLQVVDTFGRARRVSWYTMVGSEPLGSVLDRRPARLQPRFAQPLRLNFRWLAADSDEVEMNEHPATGPVCGWVLPNLLDGSLVVYDAAGLAVGALTAHPGEPWQAPPGTDRRVAIEDVASPALRRMLRWLAECQRASRDAGATPFLERFLTLVERAVEQVEPDQAAHHPARALLVGRPLALVRATLNLELQGPPARHLGWSALRREMRGVGRDTRGFEHVRVPVRLGEHGRLNDGLVGYWIEEGDGYAGGRFHSPQVDPPPGAPRGGDPLVTYGHALSQLQQAPASPAQTVSMLVDPRGVVHATCGVVPTKAIGIPPDQYRPALEAMEVAFLTAPLLTERGTIRVMLPDEPGYAWSWLARERGGWTERGAAGVLARREVEAEFGDGAGEVWRRLLERGWTTPLDEGRAAVVPSDRRTDAEIGDDLAGVAPRIEAMLARTHLLPFQPGAAFTGPQELREGWLELRAVPGAGGRGS